MDWLLCNGCNCTMYVISVEIFRYSFVQNFVGSNSCNQPLQLRGPHLYFKDNGFGEMLYGVQWEVLPTDIQMVIMLIINRNQNGCGLKFGPFGNCINRETFKIVRLTSIRAI